MTTAPGEAEKVEYKEIVFPNQAKKWLIGKYIFIRNVENDRKVRMDRQYLC